MTAGPTLVFIARLQHLLNKPQHPAVGDLFFVTQLHEELRMDRPKAVVASRQAMA
jgi:hypothetical protein